MSKTKIFLFLFALIYGILSLILILSNSKGYGIINKENKLLLLNLDGEKKELYTYEKNTQYNSYYLISKKLTREFPLNTIEEYGNLYQISNKGKEVIYFNQEFYSSYYYGYIGSLDNFYKTELSASFLDNNLFIIPSDSPSIFQIYANFDVVKLIQIYYKNNADKFNQLKQFYILNY